jgi:hypothetical protein
LPDDIEPRFDSVDPLLDPGELLAEELDQLLEIRQRHDHPRARFTARGARAAALSVSLAGRGSCARGAAKPEDTNLHNAPWHLLEW